MIVRDSVMFFNISFIFANLEVLSICFTLQVFTDSIFLMRPEREFIQTLPRPAPAVVAGNPKLIGVVID